jgi:branched-subunit amino acid transport protein AzlD
MVTLFASSAKFAWTIEILIFNTKNTCRYVGRLAHRLPCSENGMLVVFDNTTHTVSMSLLDHYTKKSIPLTFPILFRLLVKTTSSLHRALFRPLVGRRVGMRRPRRRRSRDVHSPRGGDLQSGIQERPSMWKVVWTGDYQMPAKSRQRCSRTHP